MGERKEVQMTTEIVDLVCTHCQTVVPVSIDLEAFQAWKNGLLIQDAFPLLTADEREMIKTRTCGDCWDKMFPEEEFDEGIWN